MHGFGMHCMFCTQLRWWQGMKVTYSRFPGRRCRMPVLLSTPPGQSSAVKTGKKGPGCQKRLQKRRDSDCHLATEGTKEQASGFVGAGQSRPTSREAWFKHKKIHSSFYQHYQMCDCLFWCKEIKPGRTQPLVCWTRRENVECRSSVSKKYSR